MIRYTAWKVYSIQQTFYKPILFPKRTTVPLFTLPTTKIRVIKYGPLGENE